MSDVMTKEEMKKAFEDAMPSLKEGKPAKGEKNKASEDSPVTKQAVEQAKARGLVQKTGQVEANTGQLRNVGEGPMVLRTEEPQKPAVDAVTGASGTAQGMGGRPPSPPSGAVPVQEAPQIDQTAEIEPPETPDMRMKDTLKPSVSQSALADLEKEEGPGFWDILEAAMSGWNQQKSAWATKQGEKRKEKAEMAKLQLQSSLDKANQLEILARQAEMQGKAADAQALRDEAAANRKYIHDLGLLQKEADLKKRQCPGKHA